MEDNPQSAPDQQPETPKPLPNRTQYMADMDNFMPPVKPKHFAKTLAKVALIVIVLAGLAGGAYWFANHHSKATKTASSTPKTTQSATDQSVTSITSDTKHYASTNYNLGFDYPNDWIISDTAGSKLTATSPALQLKGTDGQGFSGQIVLTIQSKQTSVSQFATNKAVAVRESQKLTYKTPTPNQRAQTYLTFVSYSGSTSDIDALYITGNNGYQAAQNIPMSDIVQDDPLVSVNFLKCPDAACKSTNAAATIPATDWADSSLATPLVNLLQSLTIQ